MKDYYELLELSKNASEDTIKKVFRILIKKNHPDLFEGEEKKLAEEKVKLLNEAYEVLIDKEKRKDYDFKLNQYNQEENEKVQTLIEENEYLKSVITEKNKIIQEFLEENNMLDIDDVEENIVNNVNEESKKIGYRNHKMTERVKDMLYMLLITFIGIVLLLSITSDNIFDVFKQVFENMF